MNWTSADLAGNWELPLDAADRMVEAWAEQARIYWGHWGPLGEPALHLIDQIAQAQRGYLAWLRTGFEAAAALRAR
jgi:hypothetical protein